MVTTLNVLFTHIVRLANGISRREHFTNLFPKRSEMRTRLDKASVLRVSFFF